MENKEEKIQLEDIEKGKEEAEEKKPAQTREENAFYAQLRRDKEKAEREAERAKGELRERRISQVSDEELGKLGFRREELSDPDRLSVAEAYSKAVREGEEDPVGYAWRKAYEDKVSAERTEKEKAQREKEAQEKLGKSVAKVFEAHGVGREESAKTLADGSPFVKAFGKYFSKDGSNVPTLLSVYLDLEKEKEDVAKRKSNLRLPGASDSSSAPSKKDYSKMTSEELSRAISEGMRSSTS